MYFSMKFTKAVEKKAIASEEKTTKVEKELCKALACTSKAEKEF